jgi:hypothetical protein
MTQPQTFANSVGRVICLAIMSLIVVTVASNSAIAQSTDIGNPTRLTSTEISGSYDSENRGDNYFYSFTAGPGELVITFSLKGPGSLTTSQYSVSVLDENSKELGGGFVTAGGGNSEQQVLRVKVPRKQVVLLRIRNLTVIGGGTATYRLRVSGDVHIGQAAALDPIEAATERSILMRRNQSRNNSECLPKQGTLIVKMKDGSKKIIDLSEAETVTIVP